MKALLTFFILILLISCNKEKTNQNHADCKFENILHKKDTLYIKSQFQDCGEWGGHQELIKIYKTEKAILLNYIKYEANCFERDNCGSLIQNRKFSRYIVLSESQGKAVMDYINTSMKLKFIKPIIGNSGNSFLIENAKGDLHFSYYGNDDIMLNNYNVLMKDLNFGQVKIHQP